jgi:hypothetical protein
MRLPRRQRSLRCFLTLSAWLAFATAESGAAHAAATSRSSSPPIVLTQGVTYRARLKLGFLQCLASRGRIERKLGGGGFANVRVFVSARDLPEDWPVGYRAKTGSCERYAEGVWARTTTPRKRPASIDAWWIAPAPKSLSR